MDRLHDAEEAIRRGVFPADSKVEDVATQMENSVRQLSEWRSTSSARWSPLEPTVGCSVLNRAEEAVLRGLAALGIETPSDLPALGTLPNHDVISRAMAVPGSDSAVIVFDSGIQELAPAWGAILGAFVRSKYSDAVAMLFIDLIYSQVVLGSCGFMQRSDFAIDPEAYLYGLSEVEPFLETFLLAHEYGHILLQHPLRPTDESTEARHTREFEADEFGLKVTLASSNNPLKAYVVVSSLLGLFCFFERGLNLMEGDRRTTRPTTTHPAAADRRAKLYRAGRGKFSADDRAEVERAAALVEVDTLRLWLPLENTLWRYRQVDPLETEPAWPPEPVSKRAGLANFVGRIARLGSQQGLTIADAAT